MSRLSHPPAAVNPRAVEGEVIIPFCGRDQPTDDGQDLVPRLSIVSRETISATTTMPPGEEPVEPPIALVQLAQMGQLSSPVEALAAPTFGFPN
jgi:hypothetical protein